MFVALLMALGALMGLGSAAMGPRGYFASVVQREQGRGSTAAEYLAGMLPLVEADIITAKKGNSSIIVFPEFLFVSDDWQVCRSHPIPMLSGTGWCRATD